MDLGDGKRALFLSDKWLDGRAIEDIAPCLHRPVGTRTKKQRTVAEALTGDQWVQDIRGALTVQVRLEFLQVWDLTRGIQLHSPPHRRIRLSSLVSRGF
jgi:hypothetical protein